MLAIPHFGVPECALGVVVVSDNVDRTRGAGMECG